MTKESLIDILHEIGISSEVMNFRNGNQVQIPCPLVNLHKKGSDNKPSLSIKYSDDKPTIWKCFGCNSKGKLWELAHSVGALNNDQRLLDLGFRLISNDRPTLYSTLSKATKGIDRWIKEKPEKHFIPRSAEEILKRMYRAEDIPHVRQYLNSRGIQSNVWRIFNLRYDYKEDRVVFPVYDRANVYSGSVGRIIPTKNGDPKDRAKYKNYFGFSSTESLGGENLIHPDRKRLIIVEGWMCVVKGYNWVEQVDADIVCTWHAEISNKQAEKILELDRPTQIWYDNDPAGMNGIKKAGELFKGRLPSLCKAQLNEKEDIGSMNEERFLNIFNITRREYRRL